AASGGRAIRPQLPVLAAGVLLGVRLREDVTALIETKERDNRDQDAFRSRSNIDRIRCTRSRTAGARVPLAARATDADAIPSGGAAGSYRVRYSARMFASFTTFVHFAISTF